MQESEPSAPRPPYIGAAYYPEAWPLDQIDADLEAMRQMGVNLVRVAEFAWSTLEPREGEYDFGWLHDAVERIGNAGIAIVMCTPTATPPAWLTGKYPDVLPMNVEGLTAGHGGRRHYSPFSETYRKLCRGIVEKMGAEFGNHPGIVAWQIDNELFEADWSPQAQRGFAAWLEKRYGTVEELNRAWNTALWSQTYPGFDEVPLPNPKRVNAFHASRAGSRPTGIASAMRSPIFAGNRSRRCGDSRRRR